MMNIQEAITRKRADIQKLEDALVRLEEAKKDLAALERAAAILGVEDIPSSSQGRIKPQSTIGVSIDILRESEELLLHVDKILEKLKEKGVLTTKTSLASSLSKYEKQQRIFCRGPEPNTFGLIERQKENKSPREGTNGTDKRQNVPSL